MSGLGQAMLTCVAHSPEQHQHCQKKWQQASLPIRLAYRAWTSHGTKYIALSNNERSSLHECADEQVELPTWGRLDRSCSWEAFAKACSQPDISQQVLHFKPEAALGVDWSSLPVYEQLTASLALHDFQLPYVYMNYRWPVQCLQHIDHGTHIP